MMLLFELFQPTRPPMVELLAVVPATVTAAQLLATLPWDSPTSPPPTPLAVTLPVAEVLLMAPSEKPTRMPTRSCPVTDAACRLTLLTAAPVRIYPNSPTWLVDGRLIARFEITRPWPSRLPANAIEAS